MRTSAVVGLLCVAAVVVVVLAGCSGSNGRSPGFAADSETGSGLAPIETNATGEARVIIGFDESPGAEEQALVESVGGTVKYVYHLIPAIAATVPEAALAELSANPSVAYVEGDVQSSASQARMSPSAEGDPSGPMQTTGLHGDVLSWGTDRIDAEVVWGRCEMACLPPATEPVDLPSLPVDVHPQGLTGEGVNVAILSTGIDYKHPDLKKNYAGGYDFIDDDDDPMDSETAGTRLAGIIAAADNDEGLVGVAPEVSLYGVRITIQHVTAFASDVVAGLQWCADNNMQVAFLVPTADSRSLEAACDAALEANVLLVAGAGDLQPETGNTVQAPARYRSVIAVAATTPADYPLPKSGSGPTVELSAPGLGIYSTAENSGYTPILGYSPTAAAHVAGVAALVFSSGVDSAAEVRSRLQQTAEDLGLPGRDSTFGYGMVDAEAAAGSAPPLNDDTGDLCGITLDRSGPVIYGTVSVIETGETFTTSSFSLGQYGFYDMAPGTYNVTAEVAGYQTVTDTIVIPADAVVHHEFRMFPE